MHTSWWRCNYSWRRRTDSVQSPRYQRNDRRGFLCHSAGSILGPAGSLASNSPWGDEEDMRVRNGVEERPWPFSPQQVVSRYFQPWDVACRLSPLRRPPQPIGCPATRLIYGCRGFEGVRGGYDSDMMGFCHHGHQSGPCAWAKRCTKRVITCSDL